MKLLFFIFLCLPFHVVTAQEKIDTVYLSRQGLVVSHLDSAYLVRKITKPAYGKTLYIEDHYRANAKMARKIEMEEVFLTYSFDRAFGQLNNVPDFNYHSVKLNYQADTAGATQVENGNGYLVETLNYLGEDFTEEGQYVGGRKSGVWKGKNALGTKFFEEVYHHGVLKRGFATFKGATTKYTTLFTAPDYKYTNNHIAQLYLEDIGFYKKYVPHYRKRDRGDYWILATLVVDENGYVAEVDFDKPIANQKVAEDIRTTLLNMPKWKPARLRGINTKAKYACAIPFFKTME